MILFGGCKTTAASGVMNDLWVFTTEANHPRKGLWTQVFTVNAPEPRRGHVTTSNRTHLVIVGGKGWNKQVGSHVLHDLWSIPLAALGLSSDEEGPAKQLGSLDTVLAGKQPGAGAGPRWTQGAGFPGAPRWGATGTLLKGANGVEVLGFFGGRHLNENAGFHSTAASAYTYYNELWLYNFAADSWSLAEPAGGVAPHPRDHHGAAGVNGDLYVFGGRVMESRSADAVRNDLWSFSLATGAWTLHTPVGSAAPSQRYMPGVSSTKWRGESVLAIFGGESLPGSTKKTSMNDVWVFAKDAAIGKPTWIELYRAECLPGPEPRDGALLGAGAAAREEGLLGGGLVQARTTTAVAAAGLAAVTCGLVLGVVRWRQHGGARERTSGLDTENQQATSAEYMRLD